MSLLYHVNMYLEFLILACTIYILAPRAEGQNEKGLAVYRNLRKRGFSKEDALVIADISPDLVVNED